jgi:uncharacterized protein YjbK
MMAAHSVAACKMPNHTKALARTLGVCVLLLLRSVLHAQDRCDFEVKLLLSPTESEAAVAAFNLEKEATSQVYFFDTSALDLLSQGLIIRVRQGADNDLTVKLRPPTGRPFVPSNIGKGFSCEVDLIGDATVPSYSVRSDYRATRLPENGSDILKLLNAGQEKLLKEAQIAIDWTRVKRIADIQAANWQSKNQSGFKKLTLELWQWSNGEVLEISTKAGPDAGPTAYTDLQGLVKTKGLSLNANQQAKTSMVLETLTHH